MVTLDLLRPGAAAAGLCCPCLPLICLSWPPRALLSLASRKEQERTPSSLSDDTECSHGWGPELLSPGEEGTRMEAE